MTDVPWKRTHIRLMTRLMTRGPVKVKIFFPGVLSVHPTLFEDNIGPKTCNVVIFAPFMSDLGFREKIKVKKKNPTANVYVKAFLQFFFPLKKSTMSLKEPSARDKQKISYENCDWTYRPTAINIRNN